MPTQANLMGAGCAPLQAIASMGIAKTGLTAVGSSQATALVLPSDFNVISTAAASTGAVLPLTGINVQLADTIIVVNHGANSISIYPPLSGTIGVASANTPLAVASGKTAWFLVVGSNAYAASVSA